MLKLFKQAQQELMVMLSATHCSPGQLNTIVLELTSTSYLHTAEGRRLKIRLLIAMLKSETFNHSYGEFA